MMTLLQGPARYMRGALASLRNSVWSAPLARMLITAVGLAILAIVGRSAGADPVVPAESRPPELPDAGCPAVDAGPEPPSAVILNTATLDDLRKLPGVGPKRAEAILTLRTRLGRFRQIEDLLRVRGIGRKTLRRLRPLVRVDP